VSGDGVRTKRLGAPGDDFELPLNGLRAESTTTPSTVEQVIGGVPLRLPAVPGLPQLDHSEESARAAGPGTRLRITLGKVREATAGRAIAAKATAIRIAITQAPSDDQGASEQTAASKGDGQGSDGYGGTAADHDRVLLDLGVGLLEAAAVSPAPRPSGVKGAVSPGGAGAGLPITGSPVMFVAIGGGALVIAGAAVLAFTRRRRRFRS
jgi:LPXTG-motif cell wall-anchored protein